MHSGRPYNPMSIRRLRWVKKHPEEPYNEEGSSEQNHAGPSRCLILEGFLEAGGTLLTLYDESCRVPRQLPRVWAVNT